MQHEITIINEDNNLEFKRENQNTTENNPLRYASFSVYRRGNHYLSSRYPFPCIWGAINCHGNNTPEVPSLSRITSTDATPHTRKKSTRFPANAGQITKVLYAKLSALPGITSEGHEFSIRKEIQSHTHVPLSPTLLRLLKNSPERFFNSQ